MSMLNAEQQRAIAEVQKHTNYIKATITSDDKSVTCSLTTTEKEAEQWIPQIKEGMIQSIAQTLQVLFGISGEIK